MSDKADEQRAKAIEAYRAWAPRDGRWTPWVKPVLFAVVHRRLFGVAREEARGLPSLPTWFEEEVMAPLERRATTHGYREAPKVHNVALVIDLPSTEGTRLGVAATALGFRPIPLYNAAPGPRPIVDVAPIMNALEDGARFLGEVPLAAPPAFLLDANRMGSAPPFDALFDNRSICRASDFPSAAMLLEDGIRRVLLLCDAIRDDLQPIALAWQQAGLEVWWKRPSERRPAAPIALREAWFGRRLWRAVVDHVRAPRADGSFGHLVNRPSGGSGG